MILRMRDVSVVARRTISLIAFTLVIGLIEAGRCGNSPRSIPHAKAMLSVTACTSSAAAVSQSSNPNDNPTTLWRSAGSAINKPATPITHPQQRGDVADGGPEQPGEREEMQSDDESNRRKDEIARRAALRSTMTRKIAAPSMAVILPKRRPTCRSACAVVGGGA